jgi:hypothetical protein
MRHLEPARSAGRPSSDVIMQYPSVVNTDMLLETHTRIGFSDEWQSIIGRRVEVWLRGVLYRKGIVDDALRGSKGLWLAQDGVCQREFIDVILGYEIWLPRKPSFSQESWGSTPKRGRR